MGAETGPPICGSLFSAASPASASRIPVVTLLRGVMQQGLQIAVSAVRHVDDGAAAAGQGAGDVPLNIVLDVQGADRPYALGSMVPAHLNTVAR